MALQVYCVQPFWRQNGRFAGGSTYRFTCPEVAMRRAERLAIKNSGVLVYDYEEEPGVGPCGPPRLLATMGETPTFSFSTRASDRLAG